MATYGNGETIAGFSDPVVGHYGSVAAMVSLSGTGSHSGIEYWNDSSDIYDGVLIANVGAFAPNYVTSSGTIGKWGSFISLVLPGSTTEEEDIDNLDVKVVAGTHKIFR